MAEAKVLRLLRYDAGRWWWYRQLREAGRIDEAHRLERESIRSAARFIRANIGRHATTHRTDCIEFLDSPRRKPFDLSRETYGGTTMSVSNCHVGLFAAWVHCYAHRIGLKYRAKQFDTV